MREALLAAAMVAIAAAPAERAPAEGQVRRIEMKDVAFMPARVTVHAGGTLEWDNDDIVAHTATSEEAGLDVEVMPGGRGSAVLTRPGTFNYICRYHPNMEGQIVVQP
jgi:plastocyanin